jgi:hypothetical protein
MDSLFLAIALSFGTDFNVVVPELRFETGNYAFHGKSEFKGDYWLISVDKHHPKKAIKTLIYHELLHITLGLPDSLTKIDIMNPYFVTKRYKKKMVRYLLK